MKTAKETQLRLNELFGLGNKGKEVQYKNQLLASLKKVLPLKRYTHASPTVAKFLNAFLQRTYTIKIIDFNATEIEFFLNSFLDALTPLLASIKSEFEKRTSLHHDPFHTDDEEEDNWDESYKRKINFSLAFLEEKVGNLDIPVDHQHIIVVRDLVVTLAHLSPHDYSVRFLLDNISHRGSMTFPQVIQLIDKLIDFLGDVLREMESTQHNRLHY